MIGSWKKGEGPMSTASESSAKTVGQSFSIGDGRRSETTLSHGTTVTGKLSFTAAATIDCAVEGEIFAKAPLTIGRNAVIKGKISANAITVFGTIDGSIDASERLILSKSAKVKADVKTPSISIEEGAAFEGSCAMPDRESGLKGDSSLRAA